MCCPLVFSLIHLNDRGTTGIKYTYEWGFWSRWSLSIIKHDTSFWSAGIGWILFLFLSFCNPAGVSLGNSGNPAVTSGKQCSYPLLFYGVGLVVNKNEPILGPTVGFWVRWFNGMIFRGCVLICARDLKAVLSEGMPQLTIKAREPCLTFSVVLACQGSALPNAHTANKTIASSTSTSA